MDRTGHLARRLHHRDHRRPDDDHRHQGAAGSACRPGCGADRGAGGSACRRGREAAGPCLHRPEVHRQQRRVWLRVPLRPLVECLGLPLEPEPDQRPARPVALPQGPRAPVAWPPERALPVLRPGAPRPPERLGPPGLPPAWPGRARARPRPGGPGPAQVRDESWAVVAGSDGQEPAWPLVTKPPDGRTLPHHLRQGPAPAWAHRNR
jgi:hypothetical protein